MDATSLADWILTIALAALFWHFNKFVHQQPPKSGADSALPSRMPLSAPERRAGQGLSLTRALQDIQATGAFHDLDEFLRGAKAAYEAVISAYASGELEPIAALLDPVVRAAFENAIAERSARGETLSITVIGYRETRLVGAGLADGSVWLDVRFVTQQVSVTTDRDGNVVAGHPERICDAAEIWTFTRETRSPDPNWVLIATEVDE